MNKIVTEQTLLFLTSIQIGIFMGIAFDCIRILRKLIKHPNFLVQIEDMLYWVCCGFMAFYMLYICNYAAIRPFIFIGMILGGVLYYLAFSIWFMKLATIAIEYLKRFIAKLIQIIMIPIKAFFDLVKKPLKYINKKWLGYRYRLKMYYRQQKREQYVQKLDKKVEHYLKNGKS